LKDAPRKGPIIKLPKDVKLLPPKPNETLTKVKLDKDAHVKCVKYTSRTTFEGVHASPSKIKIIAPKDAPRGEQPPQKRSKTTVADLEKKVDMLTNVLKTVEEKHRLLARTLDNTNLRIDREKGERRKLEIKFDLLSQNVHPR
jgi:hypothetical protein